MAQAENRSFGTADETRTFPKGRLDLVNIGGGSVGRFELEPGWKWSESVKPIANTEWCEAPHFQYSISGRLHVVMSDGKEFDVGEGEVAVLPPGHDAWVVGNQPFIGIDWSGAGAYARQ